MGFRVDDNNEVIVVTFAGDLATDLAGATAKEVNNLISRKKIKNVIFHLDNCLSAEESVLKEMAEIIQSVARFKGGGRLIGVNEEVYRQLKETSLDRVLLLRSNLKSATKDMGFDFSEEQLVELDELVKKRVDELKTELKTTAPAQPEKKEEPKPDKKKNMNQIDVQFVNHFLSSTTKTLETQFSLPSKPGRPTQKKNTDPFLKGDVCGLISIDSQYFKGTLSISFPKDVFLKLVENVFGEEETEVTEENIDIVGEIANIILGDAKSKLANLGYKVNSALPHCILYQGEPANHNGGLSIMIPYENPVWLFLRRSH